MVLLMSTAAPYFPLFAPKPRSRTHIGGNALMFGGFWWAQ